MQFQQLLRRSSEVERTQPFHLKQEVFTAINSFRIDKSNPVALTPAEKLAIKREKLNYRKEARNNSSVFQSAKDNILSQIAQSSPNWGSLILHV